MASAASPRQGSPRQAMPWSPAAQEEAEDDEEADFATADALHRIDQALAVAETTILAHHRAQLSVWTRDRQRALRRARDLDASEAQAAARASEAVIKSITADAASQRLQRLQVLREAEQRRDERVQRFREELREFGEACASDASDSVRSCCRELRARSEEWEEHSWAHLDSSLREVALRKSLAAARVSPASVLAEVHESGELRRYLERERRGWSKSQATDLERLQAEARRDCEEAFESLEQKLRGTVPETLLDQAMEELNKMTAAEMRRLETIERELLDTYTPEIDAVMAKIEEEYRQKDGELAEALLRMLRARADSASAVRRLKLSLCHWRLDYQRAYHEACKRLEGQPAPRASPPPVTPSLTEAQDGEAATAAAAAAAAAGAGESDDPEAVQRRHTFEKLRRAVLNVWSQGNVPIAEIHRFLARVTDALAKDGKAGPVLGLYQEELKQYGALPLLEHAGSPEQLGAWLDTLAQQEQHSSASRSRSIN